MIGTVLEPSAESRDQMPQTLEDLYREHCRRNSAIAPHLPRLRRLAEGSKIAVEFGVKHGSSSCALLLGAEHVVSYDIKPTSDARQLEAIAGDRWDYRIEDSRTATIPPCDLLFIDSLHTYQQCEAELRQHADRVERLLVFHDSITFGSIAADGETGRHAWHYRPGYSVPQEHLGIRLAIDQLMIRDPTWFIAAHDSDSHGLLILERRR